MKSVVTLYYKSLVNKEKNFVLDDSSGNRRIETYLETLNKKIIRNFQYIKQKLSLSIKVNMSQVNLEMVDSKDLNYVKIQNDNEKPYYYFVVSKNWTSEEAVELVLTMDTLNTFKFNSDYSVSNKSLTKRMHKDRFYIGVYLAELKDFTGSDFPDNYINRKLIAYSIQFENGDDVYYMYNVLFEFAKNHFPLSQLGLRIYSLNEEYSKFLFENRNNSSWKLTKMNIGTEDNEINVNFSPNLPINEMEITFSLVRKIDLKSEDIVAPVYKKSEETLYDKNNIDVDWSLYYKNPDNQPKSPVDCYLVPDKPIEIEVQTNSGDITNLNIPTDKYVLFYDTYPSGKLTFETDVGNFTIQHESQTGKDTYVVVAIFNDAGTIRMFVGRFLWVWWYGTAGSWTEITTGSVRVINAPESIFGYERDDLPPASTSSEIKNLLYTYTNPSLATTEISMGALTSYTMNGKTEIDKTDSTNIKLINIPYSPTPLKFESGVYTFAECWEFDSLYNQMKLIDFTAKFVNPITTQALNPILIYDMDYQVVFDSTKLRYLKDSKIYHSDYYRPKFVYDSFSRIFPLEQINYADSLRNLNIDTSYPLALDEELKFDFVMSRNIVSKFLFKFNYEYIHSNEDYPNIVAVSRNNEEVLYSSQYLDYLRTGYNYDLKAKERQEASAGVGLGLSIAGLIASGVVGGLTGNPIAIGSAIGSAVGLATSVINLAKTTAQNEDNIQRKLLETQRQANSVLNADDFDLLYEYSLNKAKLCLYKVSDKMEEVLDDMFYYVGYIVNEQMIPNTSSRYWFNFVQASLIINDSANLTSEVEDDIKEKFEQGVTFLHYHNKYDFNQEMENWENSLIEYI